MADDYHVFDADAAYAGIIETGFDGDAEVGGELAGGEAGGFVEVEAQTVADAVKHADPAAVALLGGVAGFLEALDELLLQSGAVGSRAHLFHDPAFTLLDGGVLAAEGLSGAAFDNGAGEVTVVKIAGVAREDVEDDGFVGAKRAVAALVGIAALQATGDDGVGGGTSGMENGGVHLGAEAFGGEGRVAPLEEASLVCFAGLEDVDAATQSGLGDAEGDGEHFDFGLGFADAFGKEGLVADVDLEAGLAEFFEKAGGKLFGDEERLDFVFRGDTGDDGVGRATLGGEFAKAVDLRTADGLGAVDLEGRERNVRFAARFPPDKGVVCVEAGGVEHVGVVAAGGAHEAGGGHDEFKEAGESGVVEGIAAR